MPKKNQTNPMKFIVAGIAVLVLLVIMALRTGVVGGAEIPKGTWRIAGIPAEVFTEITDNSIYRYQKGPEEGTRINERKQDITWVRRGSRLFAKDLESNRESEYVWEGTQLVNIATGGTKIRYERVQP